MFPVFRVRSVKNSRQVPAGGEIFDNLRLTEKIFLFPIETLKMSIIQPLIKLLSVNAEKIFYYRAPRPASDQVSNSLLKRTHLLLGYNCKQSGNQTVVRGSQRGTTVQCSDKQHSTIYGEYISIDTIYAYILK